MLLTVFLAGAQTLPLDEINPRWNIFSNTNGRKQIIDSNPLQVDPEPFFNPSTDMHFHLFTRHNPTTSQRLTFDMNTVRNSNWNPNNPVRFIIHGYNSDSNSLVSTLCRDQFLATGDHNVIVVDWSAGSNTFLYATARNRVGVTGGTISIFIDDLHRNGLINIENIIVVGFNLGAHVAGNLGKQVTRGRVGAIFGLDPIANLFSAGDTDRLAANDAIYTEGIHTNAGGNGFAEPLARATFYPNWGSSQPGCGIDISGNCAHERSIHLYVESITSNRFIGRQCSGYQQIVTQNCPGIGSGLMGGNAVKTLSGVFFIGTNSVPPFAQN